jgi:hypothetical protein
MTTVLIEPSLENEPRRMALRFPPSLDMSDDDFFEFCQLNRDLRDRLCEATALWNMSLAQAEIGERERAISNASAALEIFEEIEDPDTGWVRSRLAEWRGNAGHPD